MSQQTPSEIARKTLPGWQYSYRRTYGAPGDINECRLELDRLHQLIASYRSLIAKNREFLKEAGRWREPEAIARAKPAPMRSFPFKPVNFVIGDPSYFRESVHARGITAGQLWEETRTGYIWKVMAMGGGFFILSRDHHAELRAVTPDLIDAFLLACKELVRTG
jgi:hypothetical protein